MVSKLHNNILDFLGGSFQAASIINLLHEFLRGGSVSGTFTFGLFGSLGNRGTERERLPSKSVMLLEKFGTSRKRSVVGDILVLEAQLL